MDMKHLQSIYYVSEAPTAWVFSYQKYAVDI